MSHPESNADSAGFRQLAAISYQDTCAQLAARLAEFLDPSQADGVVRQGPVPSAIAQAVESAARLVGFYQLRDEAELRRWLAHIIRDSTLPSAVKIQAAEYACAECGAPLAAWLFPQLNGLAAGTAAEAILLADLHLWVKQYRRARELLRAAKPAPDESFTAHLAQRARAWYSRNRPRAALISWRAALQQGPLPPEPAAAFSLFLADNGRFRAAGLRLAAASAPDTPETRLRALLVRHLADPGTKPSLRNAAGALLAQAPDLPSFMRVFAPFATQLTTRLDRAPPRAGDLKLAGAYTQLLFAECDQGRFFTESLLVGSKFPVYAGAMSEVMEIMDARARADESFVDGHAALAVYAWGAGLQREAERCLEREPAARPHSPVGWFRLALAASLLGQTDTAVGFLERLHRQAPDYFQQNPLPVVWGMLSILLKALGWREAAAQAAEMTARAPFWDHRQALLARVPARDRPVALPPFQWPAWLRPPGSTP